MSKIEWTEQTWNPVTGCTKISQGCKFCYAEVMAKRLHAMGLEKYRNEFKVTLHPSTLTEPSDIKKPTMFFVCSMSDLFHVDVPDEYILSVLGIMYSCKQHTFQVLTKRTERMASFFAGKTLPENAWFGTSVENNEAIHRIASLRRMPGLLLGLLLVTFWGN